MSNLKKSLKKAGLVGGFGQTLHTGNAEENCTSCSLACTTCAACSTTCFINASCSATCVVATIC